MKKHQHMMLLHTATLDGLVHRRQIWRAPTQSKQILCLNRDSC